ncbi:hypothetical protein [Arenimonas donghaensis]|uniref:Glycosyltransferase RgtA/B/C/D-like domain-containing protein n=1 Tax=Arenimonas donghaensis DSM 18148 = HO3-R19 TaxID=1121014 RepID=A0A087MGK4_9GAMM|nr:hypothetical protein [Arenimonas donghaensis]KFL36007.1 hypothetical protein N788_05540 [Arenimonas donghaensis DSM 18148 = HO3-R19]
MKRAAPWLAASLGLALVLAAFWPGYLSWDSAWQWWQARTGELDPGHPPVMVRVWQLARLVLPDPGGMLLLQNLAWWAAMAGFAQARGGGAWRRVLTVWAVGAWPALLALLPHLWKDVWMLALFAGAVACLAAELRMPRRRWRLAALALLAGGCAFRHNALPAALPLLAWIAWREWPGRPLRVALASLVLAGGVHLAALLANLAPGARDTPVWPVVAMWDIAAVSIAEDRVLFPPDWVEPGLTVNDLRRDFVPYVNVPSFESGQLRLNFYYDYTPAQYAQLRDAWLSLPVGHPRAYFGHRAEVSAYLLGLRQAAQPDFQVLQPAIVPLRDNPALAPPSGFLHRSLQPRLDALVDTPLFAGWIYLVLAAGVLAMCVLRRRDAGDGLAAIVATSGLLIALPLLLLAPSADFRYLAWLVAASLMAFALTTRRANQ